LRLIFEEVNLAGVGKVSLTGTVTVVVVTVVTVVAVVDRWTGLAVSRTPKRTAATVTSTMTAVHQRRRRVFTDET
jgi:hypothetical protein